MSQLEVLRRDIDRIDQDLLHLINQRAQLALQLGEIKSGNELEVYSPAREEELVARVVDANEGPLSDDSVRFVMREVISGCRSAEEAICVAFLGPEYSYSHLAALHRFGQSAHLSPVGTIAAVFEEVERKQAAFGIVPIENSTDGRVADTLDRISRSPVRICGEIPLAIHHCLLGLCEREHVEKVYSKPQALSQCRKWLARHLPQASPVEVASTSHAAELANQEKNVAAIASKEAGIHHHLNILAENIEDSTDNVTRFAVISDRPAERTGDDKTALMFEIAHRPGALADAMMIFKRHSLNMTWIESFPIPQSRGRYLFFVECCGHQQDETTACAIEQLTQDSMRLEVLGSYARMEPVY